MGKIDLKQKAQQIRDERGVGGNTAYEVGGLIEDIIENSAEQSDLDQHEKDFNDFKTKYENDSNVAGGYAGLDDNRHIDSEVIPLDYRRGFGYKLNGGSITIKPTYNELFGIGDFSIEVFFRPDVVNQLSWVILKLTPSVYWGIFINSNGFAGLNMHNGSVDQIIPTKTKLNIGQWYHLVVVRKESIQSVYLNSVCENIVSYLELNPDNSEDLHIGGQSRYEMFKGDIALVRLYNRALSQEDVVRYYNQGKPYLQNLKYEDNILVGKRGCILELLPENAIPDKWIESQNNFVSTTIGNLSVNLEPSYYNEQIVTLITANIEQGVSNKDFILPSGYCVESVYAKSSSVINDFTLSNNQTGDLIINNQSFDSYYGEYFIALSHSVSMSSTTLRLNAKGNNENGLVVKINIKKCM